MASKIKINLDTSKELFLDSKCKQNDDLTLEANIYENGLAKDLTNCSISIQALKADKTYVIQNTDITKSNNKFVANLVRDFTRIAGKTLIEVVLTESGKQNTTFSFYIEVVGSVIKGAVESNNTVTILENLQDKIEEAGQVKAETEQLIATGGAATKGDIATVNSHLEQITNKKIYLKNYKRLNGETDDTGRFNRALTDLGGYGELILPLEEFTISTVNFSNRMVKIKADAHIGENNLEYRLSRINVTENGFQYNIGATSLEHGGITIENLNINGTATANCGLKMYSTSGLRVNNCKFANFNKTGAIALDIDGGLAIGQYGIVENCNFFDNETSIQINRYNGLRILNPLIEGSVSWTSGTPSFESMRSYGIRVLNGDSIQILFPIIQFVRKAISIETQQQGFSIVEPRLEAIEYGIIFNCVDSNIVGGFINNAILNAGIGTGIVSKTDDNRNAIIGMSFGRIGTKFDILTDRMLVVCKELMQLPSNNTINIGDILLRWTSAKELTIENNLNVNRHLIVGYGIADGRLYFGSNKATSLFKQADNIIRSSGYIMADYGFGCNSSVNATTLGSVIKKMPIYNSTGTLLGYIPIYNDIT